MSFPDSSVGKESACNAGDLVSIPGLGRSLGDGKGYPLQYSGLENSMDYINYKLYKHFGFAKSRTQLCNFHFHFIPLYWCTSLSFTYRWIFGVSRLALLQIKILWTFVCKSKDSNALVQITRGRLAVPYSRYMVSFFKKQLKYFLMSCTTLYFHHQHLKSSRSSPFSPILRIISLF